MKRVAVVAGAVAVTALAAWLAFLLGAVGFDTRRFGMHEGRLRRLAAMQPTVEQVTQGLNDEGSPLLSTATDEASLRRAVARYGAARSADLLDKGRRFPQARVFLASDMIYFIYFDAAGVMRDFACVSRDAAAPQPGAARGAATP